MDMKLKQGLKIKQSQRMILTPQMQQAIHFLSLTHLEMSSKIAEAMMENPLLEESESFSTEEGDFKTQEASSEHFELPTVVKKDDFDWDSYIESYNNTSSSPSSVEREMLVASDLNIPQGQTLGEHLEWQLRMENWNETDCRIALEIIHNLSEEGYLETPLRQLAEEAGWDWQRALSVRSKVQRFDPVGCGADNLQECLLFQAEMAGENSSLMERVIREYVGKREEWDCKRVAKEWGVHTDEIKSALDVVKNFHPRPGLLISNQSTHYIIPDVYVVKQKEDFAVRINDEGIPRLRISKTYRDMISSSKQGDEAADYVREKLDGAMWLIKSVQNRQKTLYRVAQAIVSHQQEFFQKRGQRSQAHDFEGHCAGNRCPRIDRLSRHHQ